jgi:hypothetical protein
VVFFVQYEGETTVIASAAVTAQELAFTQPVSNHLSPPLVE